MSTDRNNIKVFVASTVYNFQPNLDSIFSLLDSYGYDVLNSHKGTISIDSNLSNIDNCLQAVNECDVFVGFIRPYYGSGVLEKGGKSITHLEFETALQRNIPRFILADYRVTFTKSLLRKAIVNEPNGIEISINSSNFTINDNNIMDMRCVQMYEDMTKDKVPPINRVGHWVQEYYNLNDILLHLESQFKYPKRIENLISKTKGL